jgi:pimeloyl-ACP methyl ester carboxylesterase
LRRWSAGRIEREAHRIEQPALLIWGEDDPEIPLTHGRRLFEKMKDARLVVFQHCGHMPMEEYPREFTEVVTGFCSAKTTIDDRRWTMDESVPSMVHRPSSIVS